MSRARRALRNLRTLLFYEGRGWLRWGFGAYVIPGFWYDPPDEWEVAPPLRRAWLTIVHREDGSLWRDPKWPREYMIPGEDDE